MQSLVAHARRLIELAYPTTAYLLRVLDALTSDDVDELGKWNLDKPKSESIVDRLSAQLGERREVVREVLGTCLRLDLWGDYAARNAELLRGFLESGVDGAEFDRFLGKPPTVYPYLQHFVIGTWVPEREERSLGYIIEDDRQAAICYGYLVAKGMAFETDLDLLETSAQQEWRKWRIFWNSF